MRDIAACLYLYAVSAYLHHRIASSTNLETAISEQISPVSCAIETLAQLIFESGGGLNEANFVYFGSIEVAQGKSGTTNVDLKNVRRLWIYERMASRNGLRLAFRSEDGSCCCLRSPPVRRE